MSKATENKEVLLRAWLAYDSGDEAAFAACLDPDWEEHDSRGNTGTLKDEIPTMRLHKVAFPDKHTEILRVVADDEVVALHGVVRATHTGRYFDLEPTGKKLSIPTMMFNRMKGGRILETWAMTEAAGFYEQISGRPQPAGLDNMG